MVNLEKLNRNLLLIIADVIKNEVAETVKIQESQTIADTIYNEFEPAIYQRRGTSGGLADTSNMKVSHPVLRGNTVSVNVRNVTKGNNAKVVNNLQYIVETNMPTAEGNYYDFQKESDTSKYYLKPRPFQAHTVMRLKKNKAHLYAMKRGLMTKHGIKKVTIL